MVILMLAIHKLLLPLHLLIDSLMKVRTIIDSVDVIVPELFHLHLRLLV